MQEHPLVVVFGLLQVQPPSIDFEWAILRQPRQVDKELIGTKSLHLLFKPARDMTDGYAPTVLLLLFPDDCLVLRPQSLEELLGVIFPFEKTLVLLENGFNNSLYVRRYFRQAPFMVRQAGGLLLFVDLQPKEPAFQGVFGMSARRINGQTAIGKGFLKERWEAPENAVTFLLCPAIGVLD